MQVQLESAEKELASATRHHEYALAQLEKSAAAKARRVAELESHSDAMRGQLASSSGLSDGEAAKLRDEMRAIGLKREREAMLAAAERKVMVSQLHAAQEKAGSLAADKLELKERNAALESRCASHLSRSPVCEHFDFVGPVFCSVCRVVRRQAVQPRAYAPLIARAATHRPLLPAAGHRYHAKIERLEAQLDALRDREADARAGGGAQEGVLRSQVAQLEDKIDREKRKKETARAERDYAEKQAAEAGDELTRVAETIETLRRAVDAAEAKAADGAWAAAQEAETAKGAAAQAQAQLLAREQQVADLTQQLQNARGRILGLEEESGLFQGISEESAKIVHEIYTALKSTAGDGALDSPPAAPRDDRRRGGGGGGGGSAVGRSFGGARSLRDV
jgi:chromosome segregation ATPase